MSRLLFFKNDGKFLIPIDIAWPQGIQSEFSEPIALLINDDNSHYEALNRIGYKYFSSLDAFKSYVEMHYIDIE